MPNAVAERPKVGRKKNPIPNDYINTKIPRDIHRLAQLIVTLSDGPKLDIGQVIASECRDALKRRADALYKASKLDRT